MNKEFVLWGFHPRYAGGVPIKLNYGSARSLGREKKFRERTGWVCALYAEGAKPVALRLQAEQAKAGVA